MNILNKGHKYALTPTFLNLPKLAIDIEDMIRGAQEEETLKKDLIEIIKREERKKGQQPTNSDIKGIKEEEQNILTNADKNASLVILNKNDYLDKTLQFFNENNFTEIKRNPTYTFHAKFKKPLKTL
ncbi:uncharacterized protein [Onthophagus taurus]|uniref:uncharacterized protein n=1 Tax=Onthophagus taurus TaxID=166361 RepID=UPI0039BE12E8